MGQYVHPTPDQAVARVVTIPCGEIDLETLLSHIDYQLGTDFGAALGQLADENFHEGRVETANAYLNAVTPTASVQHDYDALSVIHTAEVTGYANARSG